MVSRLVLLCALALTACPSPPKPPPVGEDCDAACLRMQELECPDFASTPSGATCWEVCTNAERHGVDWATGCLATAPSCEAAESC